ncbi:MAG: hypothetical protein HY717_22225 [Planctomycetes bacterium]|nr:hypothetical protein [Planctomycetota bacterium]
MVESRKKLNLLAFLGFAAALSLGSRSLADTVYLKNGSWIDGQVGYRTGQNIEFKIGKIGKINIPIEEIYLIEKNNRTGEEFLESYVAPQGKVEYPKKEEKDGKRGGDDKKGGDETESKKGDPSKKAAVKKSPGAEPEKGEKENAEASGTEGAKEEEKDDRPEEPELDANTTVAGKDKIDAELRERIEQLVQDLSRDKANYRIRAENHLKAIGQPAIPFLLPLAGHQSDLTRIAVMRLFDAFGDEQVIDACIANLVDVNEYVRDYSNRTLKRLSGEDFGFVANASPRRREMAQKKWADWWAGEKKTMAELREAAQK